MAVSRWEKERAAYLLGRTHPGTSGRRRAEIIGRRARRIGRAGAGLAETSMREDVTPPLFRRMLVTNEGPQEKIGRIILVPGLFGIVGLVIGPAIAVAAALYALMWLRSPRIGRLWSWPWFVAGSLVAIGGGLVLSVYASDPGLSVEPYPPSIHVYLPVLIPTWLWSQISLGLIFAGLQIRWSGWAAVQPGAVSKATKDKNGEFAKTPESKKIRLDPLAGASVNTEATKASPNKVKLAAFTSAEYAPSTEPEYAEAEKITDAEDNPIFDDWDADDVEVIDDNNSRSEVS